MRPTTRADSLRPTTRAAVLKSALLAALQSAPLYSSYAAGAAFVQADDKSFDVTLPDTWQASAVERGTLPNIFSLSARRQDARVDATVDIAKASTFGRKFDPKKLSELGTIEEVGDRLQLEQPQPAKLLRADKVKAGANGLFALAMYVFRFESAEGLSTVALALSQGRVYRLTLRLPANADAALQAEAESTLASFRAYPLNAGCLAASSKGQRALPGVCY